MTDGGRDPGREEQARTTIKVTDRRKFTPEGERRTDGPEEQEEARPAPTPPPQQAREGAGFERRPLDEPEGVDFTLLVNAMAQQALFFLGEIPVPGSPTPKVDLEQARLQIDMLDLLRVKCRGNLTAEEEGLLERVLYQLRMLYVARSGR